MIIKILILLSFYICSFQVEATVISRAELPNVFSRADSPFKKCRESVSICLGRLQKGETCDVLPTLPKAMLQPIPFGSYQLTELRSGVWQFNDGIYVLVIAHVGDRVVVVDFPSYPQPPNSSETPLVALAVQEILNGSSPKLIDMVFSHAHLDHMNAAGRFHSFMKETHPKVDINVWASSETKQTIRDTEQYTLPVANKVIGRKVSIMRMSRNLEIQLFVVGGHTQEDVAVYMPPSTNRMEKGVLMFVDMVFPGWVPGPNLDLTQDVRQFMRTQERLSSKLDFEIFIAGHLRTATKGDIDTNLRYTYDVIEAARSAVKSISQEDLLEAGLKHVSDRNRPEFGNIMFSNEVTIGTQSEMCFGILLEKWGCHVGGVDINGRSHCKTALYFLGTQA